MPEKEIKINIAIVGCGAVAKDHLKTLKKIDSLQLVALCDKNEKVVARMPSEWNINRYYTNFSEMLDNENISILSILTPPQSHAPLTIEAIRHGVNVLVEKPLTIRVSEADLILNSLKGSRVS